MTDDDVNSTVHVDGSTIGGDVVGRDKIVNNIQTIYQRALTAAEESSKDRALEKLVLAQGVSAFAQQLQARAADVSEASSGNPYKGLLSYRLGDSQLFFGRAGAIRDLLQQLATAPLTVLHAESGAGKTSLLQAGLSPRLIAGGHLPLYLRPYNVDPTLVIKRAFLSDPSQTPLLATAPLRDFLRQVGGVLGPLTTLYIYLDQFEEFFTFLHEAARADFVGELAECLDDESLNVRWVLSLRTEGFGNLANFRPRIRNPFENDYRLNRLTRVEATAAMEEPVHRRGVRFETGLVDFVLDELGQTEIAPPQIQLVCSALFEELEDGEATITRALYEREGKAAGILRGHLERVLSRDLTHDQRAAARRLLESLITSEQQRVLRTQADLVTELSAQGVTPQTLSTILDQLVNSRLLRVEETDTGLAYELAHDYLLQEIKLDPEVQARKAAQELLEQELRAYRRFKTLLTAERLAVIEPYHAELRLTAEAEELLAASRALQVSELEAAKKRAAQLRQTALYLAGALVLAVVAFVAAGVFGVQSTQNANAARTAEAQAIQQQQIAVTAQALADQQRLEAERQAQIAFAGKLAAQGQVEYEDNPLLGLRLALEGYAFAPSDDTDTRQSTADTIRKLIASGRALKLGDDIESIYPDAVNSFVVIDHADNPAELRHIADATVVKLAGNVNLVTFSPDQRATYFMVRYRDGHPRELRRTVDGAVLAALNGNVVSAYFSPDPQATYLVVYYDGIPAELRRTVDGTVVKLAGNFADVIFSPDPQVTYFVVDYGGTPAELRRTTNGAVVTTLAGDVYRVAFSPDPQATYFMVRYSDGHPDELRRSTDGAVVKILDGDTLDVTFSPDLQATYFVVSYGGDRAAELHRTVDGTLMKLAGDVLDVTFSPDPQATYFVVRYRDDHPAELRHTANGVVVTTLPGYVVDVAFSPDPQATYFVVRYDVDNPTELRRTADGVVVKTLTLEGYGVTFSPDPQATYFVVSYSSGDPGELRRTVDGTLVKTLTGAVSRVAFSPDAQATYFVVHYNGDLPAELRHTADGTLMKLSHDVYDVTFSPDPQATYFVVDYFGGNPAELRRTTDGAVVNLNGRFSEVIFSPDLQATYFLVSYDDSTRELWTTLGEPHRLVQFGLGLDKVLLPFEMNSQRFIIRYNDGRAYLLDLALLSAVGGDAAALLPEDLTRLACEQLFAPGKFDEAQLAPYLGGQEARACK